MLSEISAHDSLLPSKLSIAHGNNQKHATTNVNTNQIFNSLAPGRDVDEIVDKYI